MEPTFAPPFSVTIKAVPDPWSPSGFSFRVYRVLGDEPLHIGAETRAEVIQRLRAKWPQASIEEPWLASLKMAAATRDAALAWRAATQFRQTVPGQWTDHEVYLCATSDDMLRTGQPSIAESEWDALLEQGRVEQTCP